MSKAREDSWRAINRRLHALTESEIHAALQAEIVGLKRVVVAERLHQRYSMLRSQRERREIMENLNGQQFSATRNPFVPQPDGAETHSAAQPTSVVAVDPVSGG